MIRTVASILAVLCMLTVANLGAEPGPFDGARFKGRIALSHDGNYNDEDDWGAFPVAIAMLDAFGVKDKIVHIDYNNIVGYNDERFEREMTASVLGAASRYGVPASVLKNCRTDPAGAIRSITDAVNASSADNPLYYLLAGPMDVPYAGIKAADPAKRRFVYCISHSVWNDGYGRRRPSGDRVKRDVIGLGINWIQVQPGNRLAPSTRTESTPAQWALVHWMRDSADERHRWLYSRIQAVGRVDVSDATMAYFLLTGDETCDIEKLRSLLEKKQRPQPTASRPVIRLEAENFQSLEHTTAVLVGRPVSQSLSVRTSGTGKGAIRTKFHEIYAAPSARYDVEVQYRGGRSGAVAFALWVNGVAQGSAWKTAAGGETAWRTHTIENVVLSDGDELAVEMVPEGKGAGEIDYVQLTARSAAGQTAAASAAPRAKTAKAGKKTKAADALAEQPQVPASSFDLSQPYDGKTFRGRIALSADGNYNDEDDWGALPTAFAILNAFGVQNKVVHVDYNNILPLNEPRFEKEQRISATGAAERFGIPTSVLYDCRTNLDGAVESIKNAVNASSADNPLYFILTGPMEVPYRGIMAAEPAKRQYVYCISHNAWNDGIANKDVSPHNKRDVIPLGVKWIQIKDGNPLLAFPGVPGQKSTLQQWALFHWLRDSKDEGLRWIFSRLEAEGRGDISDATITYFLLTGDEACDLKKLEALLDKKQKPAPIAIRPVIRLEAENFVVLDGYAVSRRSGTPQISQGTLIVLSENATRGRIKTHLHEPYAALSGRYEVSVRYRDEAKGESAFTLRVNGIQQGEPWKAAANDGQWKTQTFPQVLLVQGDEIEIAVEAQGSERAELEYVELRYLGLDDPAAMPGQIIVDPSNPRWLKKNGGPRLFLFGAGNPEEFFFFGTRQPDGTRRGGNQETMIKRLVGTGANTFHVLAMRDSRYNLEPGNGAPDCNPFENADISGKLDEDILQQWEGWLTALEAADINVVFTFYNDFDDYEDKAGWKLDAAGNLHPQEKYFIETLVKRFKHHKNLIWAIEESANKLSRAKQARLKKVAELVAAADNFHHPIAQMFQILYYDEVHPDKVSPEDYLNSPVKMMTWGHYATPQKGLPTTEQYYKELVGHWREAAGRYVLLNTEVDKHPNAGAQSRLYCWTSAMANFYTMVNSHRPDKPNVPRETYLDDGRIRAFMEQTDFHRMATATELKFAGTLYVLANAPDSYIAYSNKASAKLGVRNLAAGTYLLRWFDTTNGRTVEQAVAVPGGDVAWDKPADFGEEVALYIRRLAGAPAAGPVQ
ncbi:MAG: hypothetical protein N3D11_16790 [Candidatus Sumerlaeia bacterium]|nr:hypothetical protein [Candidatus Sumerlaeia bacterium]